MDLRNSILADLIRYVRSANCAVQVAPLHRNRNICDSSPESSHNNSSPAAPLIVVRYFANLFVLRVSYDEARTEETGR